MTKPSVWMIGDLARDEFHGCFDAVATLAEATHFKTIEAASKHVAAGQRPPAVIVLAQAWPGQYTHQAVDHLRRLAPLARVWGLLGSWCEGESRSGKPWPGTMRTYWYQWPSRCRRELLQAAVGNCPAWGLPVTSTEDERLLELAGEALERAEGMIVVRADERETAVAVADACRLRGYTIAYWIGEQRACVSGATAVLWDTTAEAAADADRVRQLQSMVGSAPIIALLSFPRHHECLRALQAGVAAIVSKPFMLEDLFWQIDHLVETP